MQGQIMKSLGVMVMSDGISSEGFNRGGMLSELFLKGLSGSHVDGRAWSRSWGPVRRLGCLGTDGCGFD